MGGSINRGVVPLLFSVLLLSLLHSGRSANCGADNANANLGLGYSAATGDDVYSAACFPRITSFPGGYPDHGADDSIAVFVGGDFHAERGAEVEGNVVVIGDLQVDSNGPSNFVSVGLGTNVLPNNDVDCVIVGGDLAAYRDVQTFNLQNTMSCDIVYRGTGTNVNKFKTHGSIRHEPTYDMTEYENMKNVFAQKSAYWGSLTANANVNEQYTTTTFTCTNTDDVQIFTINKDDDEIILATSYTFSSSCEDKTILINVLGTGTINVNAAAFIDYFGSQSAVTPCLAQSILWNFPEASDVEIGNGKSSEFYGSVLVAGNLKYTTTGHSGRTIVVGDLHHFAWGSEFHSFQFKPPVDLPCVCLDEYCYEEGLCNARCEDNVCVSDQCTPIEVDCAEIINSNVTLPHTVVYESCDVEVTLILREDTNTLSIDGGRCELDVGACANGVYLGCATASDGEAGVFFKQTTDGDQMDLTGSYLVNPCCTPQDPATNRSPPPPRACVTSSPTAQ